MSGEAEVMRVRLLGGFRVSVRSRVVGEGSWRLRKAASLVKLLALAPGYRLHREQVMDALWPDFGLRAASNNLRQALHVARRALEPDPAIASHYLSLRDEQLVLCPEGRLWVDVEAFEEAATTARRSRDPTAYRAAIELYSGELLPEDRYEEWAEGRRQELRQTFISLLVELAGLYEERGGEEELKLAVQALQRALAEEPTNEEAYVGLMRLYASSGRSGEALRQYEHLSEALSGGLGAEPSASTRALREDREREILEVKRALAMTRLLTLTGAGDRARRAWRLRWPETSLEPTPTGCGWSSSRRSLRRSWCPRLWPMPWACPSSQAAR